MQNRVSMQPTEQCSYKTIFHYFSKWSKARLFEDAFYELAGRIQCERAIVDTSFVKNVGGQDVVGRNPTDRGRKATKVSMLTNEIGTPLTLCFHRGNKSDMLTLKHLIDTCKRKTQCLHELQDIWASNTRVHLPPYHTRSLGRQPAQAQDH